MREKLKDFYPSGQRGKVSIPTCNGKEKSMMSEEGHKGWYGKSRRCPLFGETEAWGSGQ